MKITDFSIKHSLTVFVLIFVLIVAGSYAYISLPRESFPDITIPIITVKTAYPGVSPEDIESLITREIETELKALDNVEEMSSVSAEGGSMITVEFEAETDVDDSLQKVKDKVDLAKPELPEEAEEPIVNEVNLSEFPIMLISISGDYSLAKLKEIAGDMEEDIESVQGVLDAEIIGGIDREVHIDVHPDRLKEYGLSFDDIINTVRRENVNIPGGYIDIKDYEYSVNVPSEFETAAPIGNLVVKSAGGKPVYIKDVADVSFGYEERETKARLNGKEAVSLSVQKRSGENIIDISNRLRKVLNKWENILPRQTSISIMADQSEDIKDMVEELENNIISGFVLVIVVLMLFLGLRNSTFVAVAIPFSMLITFLILKVLGVSLNMVVLFSLILALGMLVDNAIVVVENIFRHRQEGGGMVEAAKDATDEVAVPIIVSTVTTLCAFAPLLFWPGVTGKFMNFLPKTLIITLSASLFVAVIINPVLCSSFMKLKERDYKTKQSGESRTINIYRGLLRTALKHRKKFVAGGFLALFVVAGLYYFTGKGVEFFPEIQPQKLYIDVDAPSGTKLETTDTFVKKIEQIVSQAPDVKNYAGNTGSRGSSEIQLTGSEGTPNVGRVTVEFLDYHERSQSTWKTMESIRQKTDRIAGAKIKVSKEEHGPPTGPPVNVEVSGDNFKTLAELAERIKERIKDIEGVMNLRDDFDSGRPEIKINLDREKASLAGLSSADVAKTVRTAVYGSDISELRQGEDEYDIRIRSSKEKMKSLKDIENLRITKRGKSVPLSSIADVELSTTSGAINRKNNERVITVMADAVPGYNGTDVLGRVRKELRDLEIPEGYNIKYTGESEDRKEAVDFLSEAFLYVIFLIALILVFEFDSIVLPLTILFSVVLSTIGVLLGLIVTRTPFGIVMTGLGIISLAGVVVNNAIVLIDYIELLRKRGMEKLEAVVEGSVVRFRPVVLTAVTTILGLIPLTTGLGFNFSEFHFVVGGESSDWWSPMGIAVIFGLAFATFLTLVIVPSMYYILDTFENRFRSGTPEN